MPESKATGRKPRQLPRGRHGLPRAFVIHSQRERMLVAMAEVVSEKGYLATTIADVHAAAAVSRKTFYEHFRDKEECFLAAYDMALEQIVTAVTDSYEREEGWRDGMRAALDAFLRFMAKQPAFARMCMVEVLGAGSEALARRTEAQKVFELFFQPAPSMPPDVERVLVAEATIGGIAEVVYHRIVIGRAKDLPGLRPQLMYWALVPYVGHDDAMRELTEYADWVSAAARRTPQRQAKRGRTGVSGGAGGSGVAASDGSAKRSASS